MAKYPLNLGMSVSAMDFTSSGPITSEPDEHYPGTRIELREGNELPDGGTITFRYVTTRKDEDKRAEKCSYELDLLEIVSVKGASKSEDEYSAKSDGLDALKAELEKE